MALLFATKERGVLSALPPATQVFLLAHGAVLHRALVVVEEIGIADLLGDGPRTSDELARSTSSHAPSLYRVLRLLSSLGVFSEVEPGRFALTPLSECLSSGTPGSLGSWVKMSGLSVWPPALSDIRAGYRPLWAALSLPGALGFRGAGVRKGSSPRLACGRRGSRSRTSDGTGTGGYGYMWWLHDAEPFKASGMFSVLGYGCHAIDVLPGAGLVVVRPVDTYREDRGDLVTQAQRYRLLRLRLEANVEPPNPTPVLEPVHDPLTVEEMAPYCMDVPIPQKERAIRVFPADGRLMIDCGDGSFPCHPLGPDRFIRRARDLPRAL